MNKNESTAFPKQLIFVGTHIVPADKIEEWKKVNREMTDFGRTNEPWILSFTTFINQESTEATTVMIHPDSESLEYHLEVARSKVRRGV